MTGLEWMRRNAPHLDELTQRREAAIMDAEADTDAVIKAQRDHYAEQILETVRQCPQAGAVLFYMSLLAAAEALRVGPHMPDAVAGSTLARLADYGLVNPDSVRDIASGQIMRQLGGGRA